MFDEKTYIEREGKLKDGYIRAAAMTPKIKVADCEYNIENIKSLMSEAHKKDTAIAVFQKCALQVIRVMIYSYMTDFLMRLFRDLWILRNILKQHQG